MKRIYNRICDECESEDIVIDEMKGEIFCQDCGLILENQFSMMTISEVISMRKAEEKEERQRLKKAQS